MPSRIDVTYSIEDALTSFGRVPDSLFKVLEGEWGVCDFTAPEPSTFNKYTFEYEFTVRFAFYHRDDSRAFASWCQEYQHENRGLAYVSVHHIEGPYATRPMVECVFMGDAFTELLRGGGECPMSVPFAEFAQAIVADAENADDSDDDHDFNDAAEFARLAKADSDDDSDDYDDDGAKIFKARPPGIRSVAVDDDDDGNPETLDEDIDVPPIPECPDCGEQDARQLSTGEWICQLCTAVYHREDA